MTTHSNPNFYRILQVSPDAPDEIIQQGYQKQLRRLESHSQEENEYWNEDLINKAYTTLHNKSSRIEYNQRYLSKTGINFLDSAKPDLQFQKIISHCCFCKEPYKLANLHNQLISPTCEECHSPLTFNLEKGFDLSEDGKREYVRQKAFGRLQFYTFWPGNSYTGQLVDISPCGMCFNTTCFLEPNDIIKIESDLFDAVFQAIHVHPINENHLYKIGGTFLTVKFKESFNTLINEYN